MVDSLADTGHISVILFSMLIGGIVALISKNAGMQGVVDLVARRATSAKRGQLVTWFLGIAIFFDDYANTLVVGNTMRSLTDRLRVSREKLSYIVDSTAAPIAAIALITTWIGAELGYIENALQAIESSSTQAGTSNALTDQSPYAIFLGSLQYAFYPIFTLLFILFLIIQKRDFGPMYRAELDARKNGLNTGSSSQTDMADFEPEPGIKPNFWNALIPIAIVVLGTVVGLIYTGYSASVWSDSSMGFFQKVATTIGQSDSYKALLWSSAGGLIVALGLTSLKRLLSFGKSIEASLSGFKTMINAVVVLILAWSLAAVTDQMHTADFLAGLAEGKVAYWLIPAITFIISALVAFSTGSSWGTMAIVYPLMLPLGWELSMLESVPFEQAFQIFLNITSCVLAGSVLGDHCSPISDTTILSSLASRCDHIAHVRTQLPYALTVGIISVGYTTLTAVVDIPWYIVFPSGGIILYFIVKYIGREVPDYEPGSESAGL